MAKFALETLTYSKVFLPVMLKYMLLVLKYEV